MANLGQKIQVGPNVPTLLVSPYNGNISDTTPAIIKNSVKNSPISLFLGGVNVSAVANVANPNFNPNNPVSNTNLQFLSVGFELESGQSIGVDLIGGEPLYGIVASGSPILIDVLVGRQ